MWDGYGNDVLGRMDDKRQYSITTNACMQLFMMAAVLFMHGRRLLDSGGAPSLRKSRLSRTGSPVGGGNGAVEDPGTNKRHEPRRGNIDLLRKRSHTRRHRKRFTRRERNIHSASRAARIHHRQSHEIGPVQRGHRVLPQNLATLGVLG